MNGKTVLKIRFIYIILLFSFIIAEERLDLNLLDVAGKQIEVINWEIRNSEDKVLDSGILNQSFLKKIFKIKTLSIYSEFDYFLEKDDIFLTLKVEDESIQETIPFRKQWFVGKKFSNGKITVRNLPLNIEFKEKKYPYKIKIVLEKREFTIQGKIVKVNNSPIENAEVSIGNKFIGYNKYFHQEKPDITDSNGEFQLTLDGRRGFEKSSLGNPYLIIRHEDYILKFHDISMMNLKKNDSVELRNINLEGFNEDDCPYRISCTSPLGWNEDCCACKCENPKENIYYPNYKVCARRDCGNHEQMIFKQSSIGICENQLFISSEECIQNDFEWKEISKGKWVQYCIENPSMPDKRLMEIEIYSQKQKCEFIENFTKRLKSCSDIREKYLKLENNVCLWCEQICTFDTDLNNCADVYKNFKDLSFISQVLSKEFQTKDFREFYRNDLDVKYAFEYLEILYMSIDYLSQSTLSFSDGTLPTNQDMADYYLERFRFNYWLLSNMVKINLLDNIENYEWPASIYGIRGPDYKGRQISSFCEVFLNYDEFQFSDMNHQKHLGYIYSEGINAYDQFEFYCNSYSDVKCDSDLNEISNFKKLEFEYR
jgi:hypothetical protein